MILLSVQRENVPGWSRQLVGEFQLEVWLPGGETRFRNDLGDFVGSLLWWDHSCFGFNKAQPLSVPILPYSASGNRPGWNSALRGDLAN